MGSEESAIEQSRSVEDLHSLRLRALLHELVRKHGPKGAAKALEIDHRTLLASMEERDLSRRVRVALEKALLSRRRRGCCPPEGASRGPRSAGGSVG